MEPFCDLVKPNTKFHWDNNINHILVQSKVLLISKIMEGIQSFDITKKTCLRTDWSKDGIGYLLLQQHCNCNNKNCCKDGWKLIYAGSQFTHKIESRYSPTEGEALAISWSLEHSKMFTSGCINLIVSTDHHSLVGVFGTKELCDISNPRICNLKTCVHYFLLNFYFFIK